MSELVRIRRGTAVAEVSVLGASLRGFWQADRAYVVDRNAAGELPSAGKVMVPWPNRVAGGRWEHLGRARQLEITEPARGNAIHGLAGAHAWTVIRHEREHVQLSTVVPEQPGWPVPLRVSVHYSLDEHGLRVRHQLDNLGAQQVPVGLGTHPYLRADADAVLRVAAPSYQPSDPATMLPEGAPRPVDGTAYDLRAGAAVATLRGLGLDNAFGRCEPDDDGFVRHTLRGAAGGARLWADPAFRWVHVFIWRPESGDFALAVEPMTCPPDALNSGVDLRILAPGEKWRVNWGIEPFALSVLS
ncbi:aldose 1-epimerase [Tamaricihabitans halophyticus]|uniref:Aldose 1-epimerase n=1 Tax=Tamaricihabitans halophyticus TaxID=1262583 RepID=A0A4R2R1G5_9PSEU|nr:aldose epimerase [Tamaricihabitans halophyticus]TCP56530.1 aldose 1-epimerase [Tamaricihabitans halophyticus]